ncbi:MAG: glycogen synthase GlgA [Rhodobacteraceae bacterium]|nr:glycogen synthase GlgA [Paracoccaceae bacterium]
MNILSVTSECAPLIKTGGLADVAGALPGALTLEGCHVRTVLPGYPAVLARLAPAPEVVLEFDDLFGGPARVLQATAAGLSLYVLDAAHLFARDGAIYLGPDGKDWPDNPQRFAALCWAGMVIARDGAAGWVPDVVHCHDWQAGLLPYYLTKHAPHVPSVMTVHNIAFQGLASPTLREKLRLDAADFTLSGYEYYGSISALKAGLIYANLLTTVSPTYARELMTPEFGMGLDGVLRFRRKDLTGILNGIDLDAWDPARDPAIVPFTTPAGKAPNRKLLLAEFGLTDGGGPLCIVVSRLTQQKGLDLLIDAIPTLTDAGGRLAVLGTGDPVLERAWRETAERNPGVAIHVGYDEALSHRMLAGADAILVPSRFEPCGLTQLFGLHYGAVPVVAYTGGLADTVIHASHAALQAGTATGIQIQPLTGAALRDGLALLCELYAQPAQWTRLQQNGMKHPVGWPASAIQYANLYERLANGSK